MTRCWKAEPKERPTFAEIYEQLHNMLMDDEVNKRTSIAFSIRRKECLIHLSLKSVVIEIQDGGRSLHID